ncbi:MAG: DUF2071 domain-containing protein [Acidobacteria bacterium]|nr:DUF2071 domain-containing protein [Acidobacteriota bacterium]
MPVSAVRPLVPEPLEIDCFGETTWIGVVPFRMEGVTRRPFPALPWLSAFPELNLRLYVTYRGFPGVWFLSLDAGNPVAVWAARRFFHLPYVHAHMSAHERDGFIEYASTRRDEPRGTAFRARYRPISEPYASACGSLEYWLTERYCLYAQSARGRVYRAEVHHVPWPLQRAEAVIERNDLLRPHGLAVEGPPVWLHFARRIEVAVWSLAPLLG